MTQILGDFKNEVEKSSDLEKAVSKFYDPDLNTSLSARNVFQKYLEDNYGNAAPTVDFDDRERTGEQGDILRTRTSSGIAGYLSDSNNKNLETILTNEISQKGLADGALQRTYPVEINNAKHDEAVKHHEEFIKYAGLISQAKKDYSAVSGEVVKLVEEELKKNDEERKKDPVMQYVDQKVIDAERKYFLNEAERNPNYGVGMLSQAASKAAKKFDETFAEATREAEKADYARNNIRAKFDSKSPDEKVRLKERQESINMLYGYVAKD